MKKVNIAVVGATGMVGQTIMTLLEERDFPIENIYAFASERSAGKKIPFKDREITIEELREDSFDRDMDIALFAAGGALSEKYIPIAAEKGVIAIDNSSFYRMDDEVPLVIPEVNANAIEKEHKVIANPNCSTIQSVMVLKPIADAFGLKRVVYNTYQAVSGSGRGGVRDLEEGTTDQYKYSIQKNVLPQIDVFMEDGYTKEERKMMDETQKILDNRDVKITATAARVPVMNSHSVSINVETERPFEIEEVYEALENSEGIVVLDDLDNEIYPLQENADGTDEVYVGRIRRDPSVDNGINLWVVSDNIRKGAATNTVQIAEYVAEHL
jgi:aspartate-semialdehyde dehydrogenase